MFMFLASISPFLILFHLILQYHVITTQTETYKKKVKKIQVFLLG
jgi:hypothetical protein